MMMMLIGGAVVCSWVFMRVLTNAREQSVLEAEAEIRAALAAEAQKEAHQKLLDKAKN